MGGGGMTAPSITGVPNSTPYPWPFDGCIRPERTALLITGAGSRWSTYVRRDDAAMAALDALRRLFADLAMLTVVIRTEGVPPRAIAAADPAPPLAVRPTEVGLDAYGLDGFYGSPLDAVLHRTGHTHVVVCGYGLETTVHSTVRRGNDRGYECLTVIDASLPHDPTLVAASRSSIEMSGGIFGCVATASDVITAFDATTSRKDIP
jgi:hypothetical protein